MLTLRSRLDIVLNKWHAADEFTIPDYNLYLQDLEEAVKDWLIDGANSIARGD